MAYYKDLKKIMEDGPGNDINLKVACPMMKDLKRAFDTKAEKGRKKGTFYFSHSTTMMLLLNLLGVSRDRYEITHDSYGTEEAERRNFRASLLTPMAANVAFVLFECSELSKGDKVVYKKKVVGYHNEKPISFQGCNGIYCDWKRFKRIFKVPTTCI